MTCGSPKRAFQNYLATTGVTEDGVQTCSKRDLSSASPVSSVVESLMLQRSKALRYESGG